MPRRKKAKKPVPSHLRPDKLAKKTPLSKHLTAPAEKLVKPGRRAARRKNGALEPAHAIAIGFYMNNGFNRKKALLSAGYSWSVAHTNAHSIFNRPEVQREIQKQLDARLKKQEEITVDWVKERLGALADANIAEILMKLQNTDFDLSMLTERERYQIAELTDKIHTEGRGDDAEPIREIKIKGESRKAALEVLAKHLGMLTEKVEVTGAQSLVDLIRQGRNRVARAKKEGKQGEE